MARKKKRSPGVDVLILHGMNDDLVAYLADLCRSLKLSADTAINLPSQKMAQEQKVNLYIRGCRLAIVLVAADPTKKRSRRARPNVYYELARCRSIIPTQTIVLQEDAVDLPSNAVGQCVVIPFRRDALHMLVPGLLRELSERRLVVGAKSGPLEPEDEPVLLQFLDTMDDLWESQFDVAWDQIVVGDYASERRVALAVDRFFQHYHDGFSRYIRDHLHSSGLRNHCDSTVESARAEAVDAWLASVESSLHSAQARIEDQSLVFSSEQHSLYEKARQEHRLGEKRHAKSTSERQIQHLRDARRFAEEFLRVKAKRVDRR